MKNSRVKNLVIIFCCVIAIITVFVLQQFGFSKRISSDIESVKQENQLETIDDSLYNENASDK